MIKILKFKIGDVVRISKYKNIFAKGFFGLKKFLRLKKLKALCRGHVICDLKGEEIVGTFYEKNCKKTNEEDFRVGKVIQKKGDKLLLNGKAMIVLSPVGLMEMHSISE